MSLPRSDCSVFERVYHDTFVEYPCVFDAALQARNLVPDDTSLENLQAEYPKMLELLANDGDLRDAKYSELARIAKTFRHAQLPFAFIDCVAPRHECLSGEFLGGISGL